MRMVFGLVSLLLVLAVAGWLARSQLKAVSTAPGIPAADSAAPQSPAAQSQQMQRKVQDDIARALQQGADRAASAAP